jgi:hypothetical protein
MELGLAKSHIVAMPTSAELYTRIPAAVPRPVQLTSSRHVEAHLEHGPCGDNGLFEAELLARFTVGWLWFLRVAISGPQVLGITRSRVLVICDDFGATYVTLGR